MMERDHQAENWDDNDRNRHGFFLLLEVILTRMRREDMPRHCSKETLEVALVALAELASVEHATAIHATNGPLLSFIH